MIKKSSGFKKLQTHEQLIIARNLHTIRARTSGPSNHNESEQSGSNISGVSSDIEFGRRYSIFDEYDNSSGMTGFFMQLIGYNHWLWLFNKIQCRKRDAREKPKVTIDQLDSDYSDESSSSEI